MAILLISMEYDAESPVAGYRHLFFFQKDKQNGQPMDHKPPTRTTTGCDWLMVWTVLISSHFLTLRAIADAREDPGVKIIENFTKNGPNCPRKFHFSNAFSNNSDSPQKIATDRV